MSNLLNTAAIEVPLLPPGCHVLPRNPGNGYTVTHFLDLKSFEWRPVLPGVEPFGILAGFIRKHTVRMLDKEVNAPVAMSTMLTGFEQAFNRAFAPGDKWHVELVAKRKEALP